MPPQLIIQLGFKPRDGDVLNVDVNSVSGSAPIRAIRADMVFKARSKIGGRKVQIVPGVVEANFPSVTFFRCQGGIAVIDGRPHGEAAGQLARDRHFISQSVMGAKFEKIDRTVGYAYRRQKFIIAFVKPAETVCGGCTYGRVVHRYVIFVIAKPDIENQTLVFKKIGFANNKETDILIITFIGGIQLLVGAVLLLGKVIIYPVGPDHKA